MNTSTTPWAAAHQIHRNAAAQLEHAVALDILRGAHAPGSSLPSVRKLAAQWSTTVPTVQRVIAGLESLGLVHVRRGSGVRVLDPREGGLSLIPLWFDALRDDAARCGQVLADFLELRRAFVVHLVAHHHDRVLAKAAELGEPLLAIHAATTLGERAEADLAFTRGLLSATGNLAASALFATVEQLVRRVPWVAEALYAAPRHPALMVDVGTLLLSQGHNLGPQLDARIATFDAEAVAHFVQLLLEA